MGHHHLLPHLHVYAHQHSTNSSHHHQYPSDVPKGCLAVRVGQEGGGDEPQRFVVPVEYLNHPLFSRLLKVAEDEYGFDQKGTFTLPCRVDEFQFVQGLIHQDIHNHHHHYHNNHHHHYRSTSSSGGGGEASSGHHLHLVGCFKA